MSSPVAPPLLFFSSFSPSFPPVLPCLALSPPSVSLRIPSVARPGPAQRSLALQPALRTRRLPPLTPRHIPGRVRLRARPHRRLAPRVAFSAGALRVRRPCPREESRLGGRVACRRERRRRCAPSARRTRGRRGTPPGADLRQKQIWTTAWRFCGSGGSVTQSVTRVTPARLTRGPSGAAGVERHVLHAAGPGGRRLPMWTGAAKKSC